MAARFRIYDLGEHGDRYTVLDSKPNEHGDRPCFGMNAYPYHPQGIGMHGWIPGRDWPALARGRFRSLGKRIRLAQAARSAVRKMQRQRRDDRVGTLEGPRDGHPIHPMPKELPGGTTQERRAQCKGDTLNVFTTATK